MKLVLLAFVVSLSQNVFANWKSESRAILNEYDYACRNTQVVIDSVVRDDVITGHIEGLPVEAYSKFKMVFYVKTNRWYVHPYTYYEGQPEGYSFSNIDPDGKFKIKTVRRDVPAKKMAAVLVPQSYLIRDQRWLLKPLLGFIGGVLKYKCSHTIIPGTGDFFF